MENDWTLLDPSFVKDLTPDQVDEVFIMRMIWGEDDYMTAYNMTWYFLQYPGLDTREKVYDKTWECIEKMMKQGLLSCTDTNGHAVTWNEIAAEKKHIYEIMARDAELGDEYDFSFDITDRGQKFLQENRLKYQPVLDEICRIFHKDVADAQQKRESHN